MSTYNLDLHFESEPLFGVGDPIHRARISLKQWTSRDDRIFISHECLSLNELDEEVDRLKAELDQIKDYARAKFPA
jgi:hypothetical protein